MDKGEIAKKARILQTKTDLLALLNEIKADDLGEKGYPFVLRQINYYCNPKNTKGRFVTFAILKKSGGIRNIAAPSNGLKMLQTYLNVILGSLYTPSSHVMGFVKGRSVITNASRHLNQNYVFNIDLKDFFSSIPQARVWKRLQLPPFSFPQEIANVIAGLCCIEMIVQDEQGQVRTKYVLPQGAPTSPVITNMICDTLDRRLSGLAARFGLNFSRYADDITFSSLHYVYSENGAFRKELKRIVEGQNFTINEAKTRLQKKGDRHEVTGLIVSDRVNVSRTYVRNLRSLLYIWEKYGYDAANEKFVYYYLDDKPASSTCMPNMVNVIEGKLQYLKMVKGGDNPVYLNLYSKFELLQYIYHNKDNGEEQSMSDVESMLHQSSMSVEGVVAQWKNRDIFSITGTLLNECKRSVSPLIVKKVAASLMAYLSASLVNNIKKRAELQWYMLRDINDAMNGQPRTRKIDGEEEKIHRPKLVVAFLKQFTSTENLKYTTHTWERMIDGKYKWTDFDQFFHSYESELKDKTGSGIPIFDIYNCNIHLYNLVRNFLLPPSKEEYPWQTDYGLKLSYCTPEGVIQNWMKENPDKQPMEIPLSVFPESYRPKQRVQGQTLVDFRDVIDIFKNAIEYRDDNLYWDVSDIFKLTDFSLDDSVLDTLSGITFYTDTILVREALKIIADNIIVRPQHRHLKVQAIRGKDGDQKYVSLEILHVESFSNKSLDDDKLQLKGNKGQLSVVKQKLVSLCDFSVESRFRKGDEMGDYRIDYLYSEEVNAEPRVTKLDAPAEGFKYILKFYL